MKELPNKAELSDASWLAHDDAYPMGAVSPPIYQSSLFVFENYQAMISRFRGDTDYPLYSRVDNPTVRALEEKFAGLENAESVCAFASGMAAISNAILSQVKTGDKILCVKHVYPDSYRFLLGVCPRLGINVEFVDGRDLAAIEKALPGCKVFYLESPSSWVFHEQDLPAIAQLAKQHQVTTIIDNSWATPIFQKPLDHGIDLVVHSASKYISGHSDTVAGLLAGRKELITPVKQKIMPFLGAKLSAHEAWLLLRRLRTLNVRMHALEKSAKLITQRLQEHSAIAEVLHPSITTSAYSSLSGFSSLFSIVLKPQVHIPTFCDTLNIFRLGVSWGGYESLVIPAEAAINQAGDFNSAREFGVSPHTIRLNIGLEDPDELWVDLNKALAKAVS